MPWSSRCQGQWNSLDRFALAGEMQAASTHSNQGFDVSIKRPWYRRGLTLLLAAIVVGTACWVSGVFELTWLKAERKEHTEAARADRVGTNTQAAQASDAAPPAPVGNDSSVSPVPLPLILTGTMPGRNAREGLAFLGVNENSPQTYAAGALLANGARITEIYVDRVVLERDGQRVDLYLHGSGKTSEPRKLTDILTVGGTSPAPPAKITQREVLTDYIRPSPVYDGQTLKGYQVYPGQQAGVFSQLGLQSGDIITSINGVPLNEPQMAIEQLKQLSQGYAVTATVLRQDKIETLSLDGGLIARDLRRLQSPPEQSVSTMPPT